MGASLDGLPFRTDPTEVNWTFKVKAKDTKTVGGKVIQVFGTDIGDMTVVGHFGIGGAVEQTKFLADMKAKADAQVTQAGLRQSNASPLRFMFPAKGWDFQVYLKAYTEVDADIAIVIEPGRLPRWRLTFDVVSDNVGLRQAAQNAYIERLAQGLGWGWQQNAFNGPGASEFQQTLNGRTLEQYAQDVYFGVGQQTPTGGAPDDASSAAPSADGALSKADLITLLKHVGFAGEGLRMAYAIAMAESGGNPAATNTNSDSRRTIDRGLFQINSYWHSEVSDADAFNALRNAQEAFRISSGGTNWSQWATFTGGHYRKHYDSGIS